MSLAVRELNGKLKSCGHTTVRYKTLNYKKKPLPFFALGDIKKILL